MCGHGYARSNLWDIWNSSGQSLVHMATIPVTGTGINPAVSLRASIIYNRDLGWDDHFLGWTLYWNCPCCNVPLDSYQSHSIQEQVLKVQKFLKLLSRLALAIPMFFPHHFFVLPSLVGLVLSSYVDSVVELCVLYVSKLLLHLLPTI